MVRDSVSIQKKQNVKRNGYNTAMSIMLLFIVGCVLPKDRTIKREAQLPPVASARKFAPEPVYYRLKTSYLPSPIPSNQVFSSNAVPMLPRKTFQVENTTLKNAGIQLGSKFGYEVYCASPLVDTLISVNITGTLEDILQEISKDKGIITSVNHENRMIQFLVGFHPGKPKRKK